MRPPHQRTNQAFRTGDNLQQLNFSHLHYFWTVARDGSIARACKRLGVTQPTISMQLRRLEKTLGHALFERQGRKLVLTEAGHTVLEYADDMFSAGRELIAALRGVPSQRTVRLHVGVTKVMPKLITYRLLEPVLSVPEPMQLVCREGELDALMGDLGRHRLDVVLSDTPVSLRGEFRSFNHMLGSSQIAICGVTALAKLYRRGFPDSLPSAPFLMPTQGTEMRHILDRWFAAQVHTPRIVGEFDDSALLKEFGHSGVGLFPVPAVVLPEVIRQYGVEEVGIIPEIRLHFYAISTERKLAHPAVKAISQAAKQDLLAEEKAE